jgi:predicted HTH transcriptional regulator
MEKEKPWISTARKFLQASLKPLPHELNEIDWKSGLSDKKEQIARHISAFSNQRNGGFFVFGINPEGRPQGIDENECREIIQKITNIARDALDPPQKIDHFIDEIDGSKIVYVYIEESLHKPVHIRGESIESSYIRSGGQTRKMSKQDIANSILSSKQIRYEEMEALTCKRDEITSHLNHEKLIELLEIPSPENTDSLIDQLINQKLVYRNGVKFFITNLGAVVAARDFRNFSGKERFGVRVIKYKGSSRIETDVEKEFCEGYAVCFQELVKYILSQLPSSEIIQDALRKTLPVIPEITIRELLANALIHRDFSVTATSPMIEIFSDRIEILNPGTLLPTIKIERIIDTAPESRNEILASFMRRVGICEERGSGIDKALFAIEFYGLPPIEFIDGPNVFKAILFQPKNFKQMTSEERLRACYQHCCLKYVSSDRMTNASFRKRLGLKKDQYTMAWKIICTAVETGHIKPGDPKSTSRKYAYYIPFWA